MVILTLIGNATKIAYKTGKMAVTGVYKGTRFVGKKVYGLTKRKQSKNKSRKVKR